MFGMTEKQVEAVDWDIDQLRRLRSLDTPARGNSILDQMAGQIARHVSALCHGDFRGLASVPASKIARDMLRIEVSPDAEYRMLDAMDHGMRMDVLQLGRTEKPFKFVGVSVYVVAHNIPAPGWRIVNPFHVKEPTP